MDEHALRVLDFGRIRELLAGRALTAAGKARCRALAPSADVDEVERRQAETLEGRRLLDADLPLPLDVVKDIHDPVWWAAYFPERSAAIAPGPLLEIAATAAAAGEIRGLLLGRGAEWPHLDALSAGLGEFPGLVQAIRRCITEQGQVGDDASAALADVRQRQRDLQAQITGHLTALLAELAPGAEEEGYLTSRGSRWLLALPAAQGERVEGIVHWTSADRSTLFVEPAALVEANNTAEALAAAERAEAERVLAGLTELVKAVSAELLETLEGLGELDFVIARAALGRALRGVTPTISREGHLNLHAGRHPLLQGRVIPIDVQLGQAFDLLLITGPNTGGKTVTLKTVGLFALMAQAGLQVPAAPGSTLPVFPQVFADIGDEQSIDQNLSTFSAHIGRIGGILARLQPGALVLLDELGAGTDPAEGAALAAAILERLLQGQARVIATTHYPELKSFARTHPRVENAAMSFDLETLRPTYRLQIGAVGTSHAFEIARRLGLDPALVEQAARSLPRGQ